MNTMALLFISTQNNSDTTSEKVLSCMYIKYSDQPVHSHSLIINLTWSIMDIQRYKVSSCRSQRLIRQCGCSGYLILCWAHMSKGTFSHFLTFSSCFFTSTHQKCTVKNECFFFFVFFFLWIKQIL